MRLVQLILLLLLTNTFVSAREELRFYDTIHVNERVIDSLALQEYAADEDFQYDRQQIETTSIFERFIDWLLRKLGNKAEAENISLLSKLLTGLLIAVAVSLLIYYLSKLNGSRLFSSQKQGIDQVQFLDFEGNRFDLDEEWMQAEIDENYPLALRLLYIKTLNQLKDSGIIEWKKEKTNSDYLREIERHWQHGPFEQLSTLFAFIRYGGYQITFPDYSEARKLYLDMMSDKKGTADES